MMARGTRAETPSGVADIRKNLMNGDNVMKKIMKVVAAASLLVSLWGPGAVLAAASPETVKAASVTVVDRSYRDNAVQLWAIKNYANGDKTTWLIGTGFFVEGGYIVSA